MRSHSSTARPRPAQVLVVGEVAAGEPQQLDGGEEAVAEAERVGLDPFLAARNGTPLGVGRGVDDLLDPAVALGATTIRR